MASTIKIRDSYYSVEINRSQKYIKDKRGDKSARRIKIIVQGVCVSNSGLGWRFAASKPDAAKRRGRYC